MGKIIKKQIQLIKIGQKKLGLDSEIYREMLQSNFGVNSCTLLSYGQANKMIDLLVSKGFEISTKKKKKRPKKAIPHKGTNVIRLASEAEMQKIERLIGMIEWKTEGGFTYWMKKKFGIIKVRTSYDAFRVIEGLKKVFENRMKKNHGKDWWLINFNESHVREYIQRHCPAKYKGMINS